MSIDLFYLNSTLNFGIPKVFVFQLEVYYKADRLLPGLTSQQKGTTARWYSNKTSLSLNNQVDTSHVSPLDQRPQKMRSNLTLGQYVFIVSVCVFGCRERSQEMVNKFTEQSLSALQY